MNLKDLVSKISIETSIPAAQVRKVVMATLDSLLTGVETGEKFTSPRLNVFSITQKSKETIDESGAKIMTVERKLGRLIPRTQKSKISNNSKS